MIACSFHNLIILTIPLLKKNSSFLGPEHLIRCILKFGSSRDFVTGQLDLKAGSEKRSSPDVSMCFPFNVIKCSTKILPVSPAFPGQGPPKRPGGAAKRHLAKATRGLEELGAGALYGGMMNGGMGRDFLKIPTKRYLKIRM